MEVQGTSGYVPAELLACVEHQYCCDGEGGDEEMGVDG
jgi:hypothetical protein